MDPYPSSDLVIYLLLLFLLFLSAVFSGTETAFFSISKTTKSLLENDEQVSSQRILRLLSEPQRLLITILIANNLVNILIASYTTLLTQALATEFAWNMTLSILVNVFLVAFVILIIGEIFPKVFAIRDSLWFAKRVSLFIQLTQFLLTPVSFLLTRYTKGISNVFKANFSHSGFSEEELKTLIDISEESGSIENEEKEMISSIMDFGDTSVKEIMIPRIDIHAIKIEDGFNELLKIARESHHSRIPVYEERIDNIVGIVYVKDLIPYLGKENETIIQIKSLLHKAYYVPEQKKIQDLLKEFQSQKMHMAIVVDEYGGTSGLVTLEDILEEIVGEIQDEYDKEDPLYKKLDDSSYLIDGKMPIEELNELIPIDLPDEDDIETISGFIHHLTGNLPDENDLIEYENLNFRIEKVENRRIGQIKLSIHPQETSPKQKL